MGNSMTISSITSGKLHVCMICRTTVSNNYVVCIHCNIVCHDSCQQNFNYKYNCSRCPCCQHIGTISTCNSLPVFNKV